MLKNGKEEIVYLLTKVIEKHESQTGQKIIRNSNRKNYEAVAKELSEISNQLPHTAKELQHEAYSPDYNPQKLEYPFRKYDITGNQVKDAYFNQIVSKPRPFLVDACYIYLYGKGRKGFEQDPVDSNLVRDENALTGTAAEETAAAEQPVAAAPAAKNSTLPWVLAILAFAGIGIMFYWMRTAKHELAGLKQDMKLLPYMPTKAEIDSLEGIWLCYTGSPQARISDSNRYHLVVANVVDVKYKNGYFTFNRYGASFDHAGYMQFESPWLVSIYSSVKNNHDSIESPRHSLMRLDQEKDFISVISASWSFDVGRHNNVIGIREVYIKQGKGGTIEEILNTPENASCRCKIVKWHLDGKEKVYYLRNERLDRLPHEALKKLLDEKSILLRVPQDGLILSDTNAR
ncbi:MAG: hypothetical protein J7621_19630 [Niastella sp.]|nr:hypothetical protein [Niastella sp.]